MNNSPSNNLPHWPQISRKLPKRKTSAQFWGRWVYKNQRQSAPMIVQFSKEFKTLWLFLWIFGLSRLYLINLVWLRSDQIQVDVKKLRQRVTYPCRLIFCCENGESNILRIRSARCVLFCDGLASHPGGVILVLLVALCYRNWDTLWLWWAARLW